MTHDVEMVASFLMGLRLGPLRNLARDMPGHERAKKVPLVNWIVLNNLAEAQPLWEAARRADTSYERLYRLARKAAIDTAGGERAFRVIGSTLAAALVRSEVLTMIYNQDEETVSPERMVEFARYAANRVTDEINANSI
jgi:hypothetical protein